jgi:hypothetical protein
MDRQASACLEVAGYLHDLGRIEKIDVDTIEKARRG